ncbi:MAG: YraN family protein [Alteromonadaceae bacterium]|nr:YraN family protein [Alteromonadaceae bacterium]
MLWNNRTTKNTTKTGAVGENIAAHYLIQQGLSEIMRNFNCRTGEIDLIMTDQQTLVFVEVKYRKNSNFGGAVAAISAAKQNKLQKTANFYLQKQQLNAYNTACRFDVVALDGNLNDPTITWIKNAF